jgi:hypothetical protein
VRGSKKKASRKPSAEQGSPLANREPLATIGDAVTAKREARDIPREVRLENFTKRLPCKLTDDERQTKLREIKDLKGQIDREEQTLTNLKTEYDGAKKSCEARINQSSARREQLISETCDGVEYRDVACQRVFDYPLVQVRELRNDTNPPELLQAPRPMNAAEMQLDLTSDGVSIKDIATQPIDDDKNDEVDFD